MGKSTSWDRAEMDQIDQFDLYFLKRAENQIELNLMVVWCSRYVKLPEGKQTMPLFWNQGLVMRITAKFSSNCAASVDARAKWTNDPLENQTHIWQIQRFCVLDPKIWKNKSSNSLLPPKRVNSQSNNIDKSHVVCLFGGYGLLWGHYRTTLSPCATSGLLAQTITSLSDPRHQTAPWRGVRVTGHPWRGVKVGRYPPVNSRR